MTDTYLYQEDLWNLALQSAVVDADFRSRLLAGPNTTLRELGLVLDEQIVVVHELRPDLRVMLLPPLKRTTPAGEATNEEMSSYSSVPPSPPLVGGACCALADAADDRATYDSGVRRG